MTAPAFVRPPREAYVRTSRPCERVNVTVEPGVEFREGDNFDEMTEQLGTMLVVHDPGLLIDPVKIAEPIERAIAATWPGRAYFIEVHGAGGWYQVFQPFGVPRNE